jgi:hypothetical protein
MGLVRNLKKRLNDWVDITLAELSYLYITQKAKQTSKKPDNSLPTEFLQNNLTMAHQSTIIVTSSQDTSEKITSEEIEPVAQIREWAIERLESAESIGAKDAIYKEFEDWIELEDKEEIEYMCLEDTGWGEQEIDVK